MNTSAVRVEPFQLQIAEGVEVFGERAALNAATAVVLLLHDQGADLDSLGWLRAALLDSGLGVISLDLPAHGLSGGSYGPHAAAAIEQAAVLADPDGARGVAFVAVGMTAVHLLRADVGRALAAALIWPDDATGATYADSEWRRTPMLSILDPGSPGSEQTATALAAHAREWNVRAFVHRESPSPRTTDWRTHAAAMVSRFVLEQSAYRQARAATRSVAPHLSDPEPQQDRR